MDMGAGGVAGAAADPNGLALRYRLANGNAAAIHVPIEGSDAVVVGNHNADTVAAVPAGLNDPAGLGCQHRRAPGSTNICAVMALVAMEGAPALPIGAGDQPGIIRGPDIAVHAAIAAAAATAAAAAGAAAALLLTDQLLDTGLILRGLVQHGLVACLRLLIFPNQGRGGVYLLLELGLRAFQLRLLLL